MNTTRICIVRHGETDWNLERRLQGQLDTNLNAAGRAQAEATARGLAQHAFTALYSSDLMRTMQTAMVMAERLALNVHPEPGLRERHYGVFQGLTATELARDYPEAHARFLTRDPDYDFDHGESLRNFATRVTQTVERIASHHAGQTLLLLTHGGVLDIVYRRITGRDLSGPRDFPVPNAALNWIEVEPQGWRLLEWADRSHLQRTLEQAVE